LQIFNSFYDLVNFSSGKKGRVVGPDILDRRKKVLWSKETPAPSAVDEVNEIWRNQSGQNLAVLSESNLAFPATRETTFTWSVLIRKCLFLFIRS